VLLKPLRDAIADGDHIYAVIKGTAVNNDGKTFGYSVPNPVAQTEVIRQALEVAHVHPRTVSYVEAHGTGTKLGDPIEIAGLSDAYKEYTSEKQYCAIGSVKSNIGHLEAAAGISQITKVILQMKHKKLVPSLLHTSKLNPNIDFEKTPFFVQQSLGDWQQPVLHVNGKMTVYPRRAGISSFGAGGVNAHVVLEEYQAKDDKHIKEEIDREAVIIVLSAKKELNLREYAQLLKDSIKKSLLDAGHMARLKDIAYTLQTGRDPMSCRLAFTARGPEEILEKLSFFLSSRKDLEKNAVYVGYGTAGRKLATEEDLDDLQVVRSSPVMLEKIAELWAGGREIDWASMYRNERRFKVSLPTYPFSKERYWVGGQLVEAPQAENEKPDKPGRSTFLAELCQAIPGERLGMLEKYLQDKLARLLAFSPPDVPEVHQGFFDLGMESVQTEQFLVSLKKSFRIDMAETALFDYPNISALSAYIVKLIPFEDLVEDPYQFAFSSPMADIPDRSGGLALPSVPEEKQPKNMQEPIAIIGMGCRFPGGCHDPETFWKFLTESGDGVIEVPRDRWRIEDFYDSDPKAAGKIYLKEAGFLQENVGDFDARFFGISPREAVEMDPQQRLLLEVSWEALERTGIPVNQLKGTQTGVFIGIVGSEYALLPRESVAVNPYRLTGSLSNMASGRISYTLGVHGPSISLDTACSSSLVAVHLACESLRRRECTLALAGGVSLLLAPDGFLSLCALHALSLDGRCKTFDAAGDGYGRGEGCGVVVLKRLSDALREHNPILAVIKGTGVNQDGPGSGLTVPNGKAQKALILKTLEAANLSPADIGYVEVHGTGTALGDPIEFQALTEVFGKENKREMPLSIGSVKSNIGHLEAAAGIASLIKTVLCLQHKQIPPNLHLHTINPKIRLESIPATVPQKLLPWETTGTHRISGVSSFGFSGTNAHVIVSEWQDAPMASSRSSFERPWHILALSAKDEKALSQLIARYGTHFDHISCEKLEDICFTASAGRSHFSHRIAFIAKDLEQMRKIFSAYLSGNKDEGVIEGKGLDHTHPKLAFLIQGKIKQELAQALFATQPIFQQTLRSCDERFQQLVNLSLLEKSALGGSVHAGLLDDALSFALHLSLLKVWELWGVRPGAVMGCKSGALVAACAAGIMDMEAAFSLLLARWGVTIKGDDKRSLHDPHIRLISGSTGRPIERLEALSYQYWEQVLSREQNWKKGIESLHSLGYAYFLHIGLGDDSDSQEKLFTSSGAHYFPSVTEAVPWRTLTHTLANLYCLGLDIDWSGFEQGYSRQKVLLPTYPFQRNYFWCETTDCSVPQEKTESGSAERHAHSPLEGRIINSSLQMKQIEYCLSLDAIPDVRDTHSILHVGHFLEMLRWAVKSIYRTTAFRVQTIDFLMVVLIPESGTVTLSLMLNAKKSNELDFSFLSYRGEGIWSKHTQGTILLDNTDSDNTGLSRSVNADFKSAIISRCTDQYSGAEFYHQLQERGLFLGESVQWLEQIWCCEGEALARLKLPRSLKTPPAYEKEIHPGVFDACAQLFHAALSRSASKDMRYMVTKWEDFARSNQPVDQVFWCHVVLQENSQTTGQLKGRFHLFDQNGTVVAQIRSAVMKGLSKKRDGAFMNSFHQPEIAKERKSEAKIMRDLRGLSQDQWRDCLNDYLQQVLARILGLERNDLSINDALIDVGMDSIVGMETKCQLEEELGIYLPLELLIVGPSINGLTESIIPLLSIEPSSIEREMRDKPLSMYDMDIRSWIVHRKSNPQARVKLFCFPYGGIRGSSLYRGWQALLPDYVEVCPVQLPGKGNRVREKAFTDVEKAVEILKQILTPELDRPYAFYGHSVGALLAYRLAYKLWSELDNKPGPLFVGAYSSPTIQPNPLLSFSRAKFKEIGYNDIPDPESLFSTTPEKREEMLTVLDSIVGVSLELQQLSLPLGLTELRMVGGYNMIDTRIFDVTITAFYGKLDDKVREPEMNAWQELTKDSFTLHALPGDHLFLHEEQDQKQLLALISHDLEKYK